MIKNIILGLLLLLVLNTHTSELFNSLQNTIYKHPIAAALTIGGLVAGYYLKKPLIVRKTETRSLGMAGSCDVVLLPEISYKNILKPAACFSVAFIGLTKLMWHLKQGN